MWFGLFIIVAIAMVALGFVTGTIWFAIPVVLAAIAAYLAYTLGMRQKGDHFARAEEGPRSSQGTPQDDAGGPTHKREEYAHTGQAYMTPEQMKRARAR